MKVLLFGATGMVGQGVLRECLLAPDVESVLAIGRAPSGRQHAKLRELVSEDLFQLPESALSGHDACFFCLGVSAAGLTEERYARVTYDLTLTVARTLARLNPAMTFIYVSGQGTDSTGQGRAMWARVKGRTENGLLALPFKAAFMFRPGLIEPLHGAASRTRSYRVIYSILGPVLPLLRKLFPQRVITTEQVGRAMLAAARNGAPKRGLESGDLRALA